MNTSKEVPVAVAAALARGDKAGAIRLLRDASGGDLKGALALVQRIAAQGQANAGYAPDASPSPAAPPHAQAATQVLQAAERRTAALFDEKRTPTVMPGDRPGRGALWLLVALMAAAVWALTH